jgi:hypothetical protein
MPIENPAAAQQCVAAELRHPCCERLPCSSKRVPVVQFFGRANVFRFVAGRRRPHNPLADHLGKLFMKPVTCILLIVMVTSLLGCGSSEPESVDVDSGSTDVADIPKHIEDFKDESQDGMVQARAMYALVKIGAPAVPQLTEALESDDLNVRLMALNTLGLIGQEAKDAIPAIKKTLDDPDADVQNRAKDALDKIGAS